MNLRNNSQSFKQMILTALLVSLFSQVCWAQKESSGSKKLFGEAAIVNNYVDKGLTLSDKTWALQAGFGYQMGSQARIGLWGSSIKLPSNSENLNLRLYFDVKMDFTTNTALVLKYDFNRYFQSDVHNGNILTANFQTFGYNVLIEQDSNWEGTSNPSTWFGFSKEYNIPYGMILTPQLGYSQLTASGYSNYFDSRLSVGYKFADVLYSATFTYNSAASQFAGRGDMAFLFGLNAKF